MYTKKDIEYIASSVVDELGESINNEINNKLGHDMDWEILEELHNKVWDELVKQINE